MVIGIEVGGGETAHVLRVIAIHRDDWQGERPDVFAAMASPDDGAIQATEFVIRDVDPFAVLRAVTHQFSLRLRTTRIAELDLPIRIMAHSDRPERPFD